MESDVKKDNTESTWRVDEENEEKYNFSGEKGLWQPKPKDILSMFDQLSKGGALPLVWACPGRRAPETEQDANKAEEVSMEVDPEDSKEEETREPESTAFDFDDTQSESAMKTTPIRALGGARSTPRTEKRVARMDNIMDSLLKQQKQRNAEREARRAKASPARTPQGRGRLLKFSSPFVQSPKSSESLDPKPSAPPVLAIGVPSPTTSMDTDVSKVAPSVTSAISNPSTSTPPTSASLPTTSSLPTSTSSTTSVSHENTKPNTALENGSFSETNSNENNECPKPISVVAAAASLNPPPGLESDTKTTSIPSSSSSSNIPLQSTSSDSTTIDLPKTAAITPVSSSTIADNPAPAPSEAIASSTSSSILPISTVSLPAKPSDTATTTSTTSSSFPLPPLSSSTPPPSSSAAAAATTVATSSPLETQSSTSTQNPKSEKVSLTPSIEPSLNIVTSRIESTALTNALPSVAPSSVDSSTPSEPKTETTTTTTTLTLKTAQTEKDAPVLESNTNPSEEEPKVIKE